MRKPKLLLGLVTTVLAGSVVLNAYLFRFLIRTYRGELDMRLDPLRRESSENLALGVPAKSEKHRIALLGDSRVEMWTPYPTIPGAEYINLGRGGETTAQVLLRLQGVQAFAPTVVLLEVGINDLKAVGVFPERAERIIENCMRNLDEIVQSLVSAGVPVLVATIFPIREFEVYKRFVYSEHINDGVRRVNDHIRGLAKPGVDVVDCDSILLHGRYLRVEYARDSMHVNSTGYLAISDLVKNKLVRTLATAGTKRK